MFCITVCTVIIDSHTVIIMVYVKCTLWLRLLTLGGALDIIMENDEPFSRTIFFL